MLLHQLWRQLNPEPVLIGVHHDVDGLTHHQIAAVMGRSRRTVGNRLAALAEAASALTEPVAPAC